MEQESVQSGNRKEKYGDSCENQRNNTEYSYNKDSQSLISCQSMFCHQEVLAQTYFFLLFDNSMGYCPQSRNALNPFWSAFRRSATLQRL